MAAHRRDGTANLRWVRLPAGAPATIHDEDLRDRMDAMYQTAERDLAERGHVSRPEPDRR